MEKKARYLLFGTAGAWQDYIIRSDDIEALRYEAAKRLKDGYTASIVDKQTGKQIDFRLKSKSR